MDSFDTEGNTRTIVAGDVPFLRALLRMAIEEAGYSVVAETTDRDNLLVSCATYNPDLVLIDMHMPVTQEARLIEDILDINLDVAIVIISDSIDDLEETLLAAGARACLEKPFSMYDLIDVMKRVMPPSRRWQ